MTQSRLDLIQSAKDRVGPASFRISAVSLFDALLKEITGTYPLLKNNLLSGSTVASQAYPSETFPTDFRMDISNQIMFLNKFRLGFIEPEAYYELYRTADPLTPAQPWHYTVDQTVPQIYFWPHPDAVYAYQFYYTKYHPASTSDTYTHLLGAQFDETIIMGLMSKLYDLLSPPQPEMALLWKQKFDKDLLQKAVLKVSKAPSARPDFWGRMGR